MYGCSIRVYSTCNINSPGIWSVVVEKILPGAICAKAKEISKNLASKSTLTASLEMLAPTLWQAWYMYALLNIRYHYRLITKLQLCSWVHQISCLTGHMCSPLRPLLQKTATSSPWTQLCVPIPLWVQERRVEAEDKQEISSSHIGPVPAENLSSTHVQEVSSEHLHLQFEHKFSNLITCFAVLATTPKLSCYWMGVHLLLEVMASLSAAPG